MTFFNINTIINAIKDTDGNMSWTDKHSENGANGVSSYDKGLWYHSRVAFLNSVGRDVPRVKGLSEN